MSAPLASSIALAAAVLVAAGGCAGMLVMRGAAARLHYVGATALVAAPCVLIAVWLAQGVGAGAMKALLIALVVVLQSPLLAHVIGRAIQVHERRPGRARRTR